MLAPSPLIETVAFSFSNSSLSSARLSFFVPRMSMAPAKLQAVSRFMSVASSPQ